MRALDRATIEDIGLPALTLMETAGRAVAHVAEEMLDEAHISDGHVAVVCGPGNNGGDGFVAARVLRDGGIDAAVYLAVDRAAVHGDAATHLRIYERAGGPIGEIDLEAIAGADLVIDALFGVGLARPIEGPLADVVAAINQAARCLAIDIPSGLDADTGRVLGTVVHADVTVTMAALKVALASAPGFTHCGAVDVADIGIPAPMLVGRAGLVEDADIAGWLPGATAMDHKGRRGHVLIIGGMPGMRGAGRLCANAALRGGAGLVTLATAGDAVADDSIMTRALATSVGDVLASKSAVIIGPGLGQSEPAAGWLGEVLASGVPAVLDADALNLVAGIVETVKRATGPVVLTPHPGEAARLLGTTVADVEGDRLAAARALAERSQAVVVLKGARTIVCDGGFCSVNPTGGPELATGGSGDVLAGLIGALLAQGASAVDAARAAVYVHGLAGEDLATQHGSRGVISSDLPLAIARVLQRVRP
jgi:NAD(P)H-hydrate epimerase